MKLADFHYALPPELIARYPLAKRSASRLLYLDGGTGVINHYYFTDLLQLARPGDLLVCNDTRVIPARLLGHKESGGQVEVLIERILDSHSVLAHVRASKTPKLRSYLLFNDISFMVVQRHQALFELRCEDPRPVLEVIETIGHVPLPPYFHRAPEESDKERYQTVYAQQKGSVAAPTAGLHFDHDLLSELHANHVEIGYVTLHVGAGTFSPVRVDDITQHRMHVERVEVSAKVCQQIQTTRSQGGRVIAVGTTAARSLETASLSGSIQPFSGDTDIFIYPGFQFHCVDALITNFHLPGSTLLMLVSAFAGHQSVMAAYQEAVKQQYRFFSYGDAMFVTRQS